MAPAKNKKPLAGRGLWRPIDIFVRSYPTESSNRAIQLKTQLVAMIWGYVDGVDAGLHIATQLFKAQLLGLRALKQ